MRYAIINDNTSQVVDMISASENYSQKLQLSLQKENKTIIAAYQTEDSLEEVSIGDYYIGNKFQSIKP
jgi:hypothetical protein